MHILILFTQPWRVGGAETHVEALIQGSQNEKIILAVNKGSNQGKLQLLRDKYKNIKILEIQARGINIISWGKDLIKLARMVEEERIEIISAQQRTAGLWAYLIMLLTGIPFVVTMHDPWHRAICKRLYSRIFSNMVVVSKNLASILIEKFGFHESQILHISNGISFETFKPMKMQEQRQKFDLSKDSKVILHVSRLSTVKGAVSLVLINAMKNIMKTNRNCQLIIIGEGPLRKDVEKRVMEFNETYGKDIIKVLDFTNEIFSWYNAADIVIAEGRVAIEALACEKPVVAIRNGNTFFGAVTVDNIEEAISVNFDGPKYATNMNTLADEIGKVLVVSGQDSKMIKKIVQSRLSLSDMANKYKNLFNQVVSKRGSNDRAEV